MILVIAHLICTLFGAAVAIEQTGTEIYSINAKGEKEASNNVYVQFNSYVTLVCNAEENNTIWERADFDSVHFKPVQRSTTVEIGQVKEKELKLYLSKVRFSTAGQYRCKGTSPTRPISIHVSTAINTTSYSVRLYREKSSISNLQIWINKPLTEQKIHLGCLFKLTDRFTKESRVSWSYQGSVQKPHLYKINYEIDAKRAYLSTTLTFFQPVIADNVYGKYSCKLQLNSKQPVVAYAELSIPPIIAKPLIQVYRSPGESFSHFCNVIAYPLEGSSVSWARNRQRITLDAQDSANVSKIPNLTGRLRMDMVKLKNDRLTINEIQYADQALYTCFVETSSGNATGGVYLHVRSKWISLIPVFGLVFEILTMMLCLTYKPNCAWSKRMHKSSKTPVRNN